MGKIEWLVALCGHGEKNPGWLAQVAKRERGATLSQARSVVMDLYIHANNSDGSSCYPSIKAIEKRVGFNRKIIRQVLKALVAAGWLADTGDRRNRGATVWQLLVPAGKPPDNPPDNQVVRSPCNGDAVVPCHGATGDAVVPPPGATWDAPGDPVVPQPTDLETKNKTETKGAAGAALPVSERENTNTHPSSDHPTTSDDLAELERQRDLLESRKDIHLTMATERDRVADVERLARLIEKAWRRAPGHRYARKQAQQERYIRTGLERDLDPAAVADHVLELLQCLERDPLASTTEGRKVIPGCEPNEKNPTGSESLWGWYERLSGKWLGCNWDQRWSRS
jgi:DNA-binding FadR family transcriptional regulator